MAAARARTGYMSPLLFTQSRPLAFYCISDECITGNVDALSDQPAVDMFVVLGLARRQKVSSRLRDALSARSCWRAPSIQISSCLPAPRQCRSGNRVLSWGSCRGIAAFMQTVQAAITREAMSPQRSKPAPQRGAGGL